MSLHRGFFINSKILGFMEKKEILALIVNRCEELLTILKSNEELLCGDSANELAFSACIDHMNSLTGEISQNINGLKGYKYVSFMKKFVSSDLKTPLPDELVENKNTIFYRKKVVLTGNLLHFPSRQVIAEFLHGLGADINSTISSRTQIVVVGTSAGPSKMLKIKELQDSGNPIRVIEEPEFIELMKEYGIE
jgi:NAD-dependent DNA ligase